jgi:hypothetical protein
MRLVLLDWFVEVHHKFQLLTETLFIAANILDRYLSLKQVSRNNLQLVGMVSRFKRYNETNPNPDRKPLTKELFLILL